MDDYGFFQVLAGVSATLLALSFVALGFFLEGLLKRHRVLALPVLREADVYRQPAEMDKGHAGAGATGEPPTRRKISDVTDLRLFDGDPLVVFVAFSVALTWNLYFISLLASVTASIPQFSHPVVFAVELCIFSGTLAADVEVRHRQYQKLRTYRTREEHFWRPFGVLLSVIYVGLALFAVLSAIPSLSASWRQLGFDSAYWLRQILKGACPFALFSALYFTNHDFFVFFKARVSDDVRQRWLSDFLSSEGEYRLLMKRVTRTISRLQRSPKRAHELADLQKAWNEGYPDERCFSTALKMLNAGMSPWERTRAKLAGAKGRRKTNGPSGDSNLEFHYRHIWDELVANRRTIAGWMIDVPGISAWAARVAQTMEPLGTGS